MSGVPAAAPAPPRVSALAALQHRDFTVFAAARFCATLAWQILGATVGYRLYQITHDPLSLALVGLAQFLPFVLCVLPADSSFVRVMLAGPDWTVKSIASSPAV